jgi:hypothetical protein
MEEGSNAVEIWLFPKEKCFLAAKIIMSEKQI